MKADQWGTLKKSADRHGLPWANWSSTYGHLKKTCYGSETWTLKRREEERLERTEMRMLRWILGLTLRDKKRNDDIRRILGVACITNKIWEARLRWFGHVQCREEEDCVRRILEANVRGQRSRKDREKGGSTSWSTTWRTCGSTWWTWRIEPSGDREPVWLTPHPRDLKQPEGERELIFNVR